jgi:hypothetical protein
VSILGERWVQENGGKPLPNVAGARLAGFPGLVAFDGDRHGCLLQQLLSIPQRENSVERADSMQTWIT